MSKLKKNPVAKLPAANEPNDVSVVGPTPYEYLFAETADKVNNFIQDVKKEVNNV